MRHSGSHLISLPLQMKLNACVSFLCGCFVTLVAWFGFIHLPLAKRNADIFGHWEGPAGGIWFDASGRYFQLDIMHTFFYGHWTSKSSDTCHLQFYDLLGEKPVTDRVDMQGTVTLESSGSNPVAVITIPDGTTLRFTYAGPPSDDMSGIDTSMKELQDQ
ncbi:hypothetical protein DES53_102971 [Roseimicrobium gellanilyticum]|uniref:Uncharacterized protein n=2 Tax=Roseimicrobium gellanilyticum TaxID=748857 RepID=A0A366HSB8_9BACT|nr:hypothetical protein DES53_102971 [Roseimicrobium gellanilyticum]